MPASKGNDTVSGDREKTTVRTPPAPAPEQLPGGRAALPAGSLSKPFFGPQGDENRAPPPNAPAPVRPAPRVPPGTNAPRKPR